MTGPASRWSGWYYNPSSKTNLRTLLPGPWDLHQRQGQLARRWSGSCCPPPKNELENVFGEAAGGLHHQSMAGWCHSTNGHHPRRTYRLRLAGLQRICRPSSWTGTALEGWAMPVDDKRKVPVWGSLFLKRILLAFWAVWLTLVFATNLFDGGKAIGLLGESWVFASGNYRFLAETTARYGTPAWLDKLLFLGVVVWEGVAFLLFWLACWTFRGREKGSMSLLYTAFAVSLSLWAAFLLADEVFIAYAVEGTHLRLFIAQLATLLAVVLLPEDRPASSAG
jgi:hypothetical protein